MITKYLIQQVLLLSLLISTQVLAQKEFYMQQADTLKLPKLERRLIPYLGIITYNNILNTLNYDLKQYSFVNSSIAKEQARKRHSTDNAIRNIQAVLNKDLQTAKRNEILGIINVAGILGGVFYQAANGEHLSKDASNLRKARTSPPARP